jgi:hypothetical protein
MTAPRFVWATNNEGLGVYVNIDCVDVAIPSREGDGYLLKTATGIVLGIASAKHFCPDNHQD